MSRPIGVRLVGDNWFHDGWLSGTLGLPRREFVDVDSPIPDIDIDAWNEGYDMGAETKNDIRPVIQRMLALRQIEVR